jgi:hypothetical protein
MDPRFYEPASLEDGGCSFFKAGERKSYDFMAPINPALGYPMSLKLRRWGPLNRNGLLFFRELPKEAIWGNQPAHAHGPVEDVDEAFFPYLPSFDAAKRAQNDTLVEEPEAFRLKGLPALKISRRTRVDNMTIDWIDTPLWIAGIDGQWYSNPFHWWSKIGALFDARRHNLTERHPADGLLRPLPPADVGKVLSRYGDADAAGRARSRNELRWTIGAQWPLPAMNNIFFAGDGANVLDSAASLGDWFRTTMETALPKKTKFFFNDLISRLGPNHIVCSRSGAIPGGKNKLFTARADADIFRQSIYHRVGLMQRGISPRPIYPPRKITVIDRKGMNGRGIFNLPDVIRAVDESGVAFELVDSMARRSFADQVQLMSSTGVLVAPHGAALANIMFLPAHAAVIEIFPYLMKKNTYRYLCGLFDLLYFPVFSWELLPDTETQFYGVELMTELYFWENCVATNITSYDALNVHACNAASKNYPIVVNVKVRLGAPEGRRRRARAVRLITPPPHLPSVRAACRNSPKSSRRPSTPSAPSRKTTPSGRPSRRSWALSRATTPSGCATSLRCATSSPCIDTAAERGPSCLDRAGRRNASTQAH